MDHPEKIYGMKKIERQLMFGLSNAQAAATLMTVLVGYNIVLPDGSRPAQRRRPQRYNRAYSHYIHHQFDNDRHCCPKNGPKRIAARRYAIGYGQRKNTHFIQ